MIPQKYQVEQLWFSSKDGTRVPMFVVSKKGVVKNGHAPTLLSGYGGFNVGRTPFFNRNVMLLLAGSEAASMLTCSCAAVTNLAKTGIAPACWSKKQNVFDDFIAAAEHLIAEKYTDARASGDSGRQQRRPADGRRAHATS